MPSLAQINLKSLHEKLIALR